jgi:hypothetical protein
MPNPNQLFVEGSDDQFTIVELIKKHVLNWELPKKQYLVEVFNARGIDILLNTSGSNDYMGPKFKQSHIETIGIVVDADTDPIQRYRALRAVCSPYCPDLPEKLDPSGLIHDVKSDETSATRLGIWIMPDNVSAGAMEDFLHALVPETSQNLWQHAINSTSEARSAHEAKFTDPHVPKAELYCWLAWAESPGNSPGLAFKQSTLDAKCEASFPFVTWFCKLYDLQLND